MTTTPKIQAKRKYTKHTCTGYTCDRPRCIMRQRDELIKTTKLLGTKIDIAGQVIESLQNNVNVLMQEIEDRKTGRHWILRKLGL